MQLKVKLLTCVAIISASLISTSVVADQSVTCKSRKHEYKMCRIDTHGYVRLVREHSRSKCVQGRTWDYDQRGIWVDSNCWADFVVETRHHTDGHKDHNGKGAVMAGAAIALIAAAAISSSKNKHEDRYHDENYGHSGHSSYLPRWMVGEFKGYNMQYGADVNMVISKEGRVKANVQGTKLHGYVNDGRLYIGDAEFYIERAGEGFNTVQTGDRSNKVHYSRY